MAPPIKLTVRSTVAQSTEAVTQLLIANGWPDPETSDDMRTHQVACACVHLGHLYNNQDALVDIYIEWTPAHYLIKVDLV